MTGQAAADVCPGHMHPRQADHAISRGLRVDGETLGDEFPKVLLGSIQFIPAVVHYSEKVVRISEGERQPARRRLIKHRLRKLLCLLEIAGFDGVEACRK